MIKKLSALMLCGFLISNMNAQDFGGGSIIGLSSSQVGGDNLAGFHNAGLLIGLFANKKISKSSTFQMEMTYIEKGSKNPKMNDPKHSNYDVPDIYLSYLEIPMLIQFHQNNILKIESGILSAYLINGYYNNSYGKIPYGNQGSPFIKYDIGLLIGINYTFANNLSLNTRISNSVRSIGKENYNTSEEIYNSSIKGKYNSVLSFAIHYNF